MENSKEQILRSIKDFYNTKNSSTNFEKHFVVNSSFYTDETQFNAELKSFKFNSELICPHRGATLKKSGSIMVCPYHGWKFNLEGKLLETSGNKAKYKCKAYNFKSTNSSKQSSIFQTEIHLFSKNSRSIKSINFTIKANWKLIIESLLETYHFQYAHKSLLGGFSNSLNSIANVLDNLIRIIVPLENYEQFKNTSNFLGLNLMYFKFPNVLYLFLKDSYLVFKITPIQIDKSNLTIELFQKENGDLKSCHDTFEFIKVINDEDNSILENQQINLKNLLNTNFHFTPYEMGIFYFHELIKKNIFLPDT